MPLTFTEVLPLPAGGYGARCTCGWFENGPHDERTIDQIVDDHADCHRPQNGGNKIVGRGR